MRTEPRARAGLGRNSVTGLGIWLWMGWGFGCVPLAQAGEGAEGSRRVLAADYSTQRIGIVNSAGQLEWEHPIRDCHDAWLLPHGHVLFQTSWTRLVEMSKEGELVWSYDAAEANPGRTVQVHSFQRLTNGLTLIAESGVGRLIEVDARGRIQHEVALKRDRPDAAHDTRLVRKLGNGNYLVAQEGDGAVREYAPSGEVVWEYMAAAPVFGADRVTNGNTVISCGGLGRVIEVDRTGKVVWSLERNDLPGIALVWVTRVERLANGNTLLVNCHAGPANPQMIEVTPGKQVVWTFLNFEHFGNAMPVGVVVD